MTSEPDPPVDLAQLRDLLDGDAEAERMVIEAFDCDGQTRVALARQAAETGDRDILERESHALKGASSYLGAVRLTAAADALCTAAREGRTGDWRELAAQMEARFAEVRKFLGKE